MSKIKILTNRPMYLYLMVLTACSTVGLQAWRTLFDNFSVHVVGLEGDQIGILQSIREIPGFLSLLVIYVLLIIKEHRLSSLSIITLGVGLGATGLFPSFGGLLVTTVIMSLGFHYFETTCQSLTLQYFDRDTSPLVFGKQRSIAAASNIAIGGLIFVMAPLLSYKSIYLIVGAMIIIGGLWSLTASPTASGIPRQRKQMVLRKRYWLYYLLTFLAGARRQIFVAFAVFLLVKRFEFSVQEITALLPLFIFLYEWYFFRELVFT